MEVLQEIFEMHPPAAPRTLLRQYSLNIPRNNSNTHQDIVSHARERWDHYHNKWKLGKRQVESLEVVFSEGLIGIEFIVHETSDKVIVKSYLSSNGGNDHIHIATGDIIQKGMIVDAINDIEVDALSGEDILDMLQCTKRPMTVRLVKCDSLMVVCRLCELRVDVRDLEEHTQYCVMSHKNEKEADEYNSSLIRIAKALEANVGTDSIRSYFNNEDIQAFHAMRVIAMQAAACDITSIESFELCSRLVKMLDQVNCHEAPTSSCVVERGLKYCGRIRHLIHAKMSQMRITQKFLLQQQNTLLPTSPCYRTKSLEERDEISIPNKIVTNAKSINRSTRVTIRDFDIIKPISKGAFGKVYLAQKKTTGDQYAIKVLAKEHVLRKKQISHIETERDILASIESPFVVKLFWTFQSKHHLFLVMEYLPGGDFMSLLECIVRLEESVAKIYIAEIALALNHLHSKNCVHRDLKPDNILIGSNGHIKLTDFGLSEEGINLNESSNESPSRDSSCDSVTSNEEQLNDLNEILFCGDNEVVDNKCPPSCSRLSTSSSISDIDTVMFNERPSKLTKGSSNNHSNGNSKGKKSPKQSAASFNRCGTPDYLSPEIIMGKSHGSPVDYWALGVILYEMLVGFPPFNDDSVELIFSNILDRRIIWPDDDQSLSPNVVDLINRLLEVEPELRITYQELICHPFFQGINWDTLLEATPPFVPTLDDPNDTSYFNNRDLTEVFIEEDDFDLDDTTSIIAAGSQGLSSGNTTQSSKDVVAIKNQMENLTVPYFSDEVPHSTTKSSQKYSTAETASGTSSEKRSPHLVESSSKSTDSISTSSHSNSVREAPTVQTVSIPIQQPSTDEDSVFGSSSLTSTTPQAFRTFSFTNMSALAAANRKEADEKAVFADRAKDMDSMSTKRVLWL